MQHESRKSKPCLGSSGILVTFEGTEGSGKTTLIRTLQEELARRVPGLKIKLTREPGGSAVAENIRKVILAEKMAPMTELFLYEAARAEHLERTIIPVLLEKAIVLCDRFTDSSLAYQGHARGIDWKTVLTLNRLATRGLEPHLTVLLDIDPAVGLKRAREFTRFEAEGLMFQKKVRLGFLRARKENPKRWIIMKPGRRSPEQLAEVLAGKIIKRFAPARASGGMRPKRGDSHD